MKLFSLLFISIMIFASCSEIKSVQTPKTETNTVDIGNKTITTITGSAVQPIR